MEPILSLISEEDGCGQIKMHADLMEDVFGEAKRPMACRKGV